MAKKRRWTFGTIVRLPSSNSESVNTRPVASCPAYKGVFHNALETYRTVADAKPWLTVEESKVLQGTGSWWRRDGGGTS